MTPQQFRRIRLGLDLSIEGLAKLLDVATTTIERWEMNEQRTNWRHVPETTALLMTALDGGFRPKAWDRIVKTEKWRRERAPRAA